MRTRTSFGPGASSSIGSTLQRSEFGHWIAARATVLGIVFRSRFTCPRNEATDRPVAEHAGEAGSRYGVGYLRNSSAGLGSWLMDELRWSPGRRRAWGRRPGSHCEPPASASGRTTLT